MEACCVDIGAAGLVRLKMFWARGRRGYLLYAGSEPMLSAVCIDLML